MRNPAAYNLIVDGKYRKRIVKSKKRYTRKEKFKEGRQSRSAARAC